jgi:hypothetical protein
LKKKPPRRERRVLQVDRVDISLIGWTSMTRLMPWRSVPHLIVEEAVSPSGVWPGCITQRLGHKTKHRDVDLAWHLAREKGDLGTSSCIVLV